MREWSCLDEVIKYRLGYSCNGIRVCDVVVCSWMQWDGVWSGIESRHGTVLGKDWAGWRKEVPSQYSFVESIRLWHL